LHQELTEINGEYKINTLNKNDFRIFCYSGEKKAVGNVWRTAYFKVNCLKKADCQLFPGADQKEVENAYQSTTESWSVYWYPSSMWQIDSVRLPLFDRSCVGVSAKCSYTARLEVKRFNFWKIGQLTIGLILFFLSPHLSRNTCLHYLTGVSVGLTGSILIVIFFLSKMVPKKTGALGILFGGWALVLYVLQLFWSNIQTMIHTHFNFIVAYFVTIGTLSFVVCYRYGPVENPRTLNLIQWAIQIIALILIFFSSDNQEFSMAIVLISLCTYNFPNKWLLVFKSYCLSRRKFPPKRRLLTEEEYRDQANAETQKAIQELRNYCKSPDCKSWSIVSRLETPVRFAQFVEGKSHLLDQEMLDYETTDCYTNISEDES
uniref:Nuclear envelope integral membrane protein 1 n=1 Tax=Strigamia maritima TaxID=126957 RepID=T1J4J3_STRMM